LPRRRLKAEQPQQNGAEHYSRQHHDGARRGAGLGRGRGRGRPGPGQEQEGWRQQEGSRGYARQRQQEHWEGEEQEGGDRQQGDGRGGSERSGWRQEQQHSGDDEGGRWQPDGRQRERRQFDGGRAGGRFDGGRFDGGRFGGGRSGAGRGQQQRWQQGRDGAPGGRGQQQHRGPLRGADAWAPPAPPLPLPPPVAPGAMGANFPYYYGFGPSQRWQLPTALSVTWLGTSSGTPTKDRNISCTLVRTAKAIFMVDCGEGSLVQLRKTGIEPAFVEAILVTHLHGDHCFGLSSMITAVSERRRRRADAGRPTGGVRVYGPPGVSELLRAQMVLTGLQHELALPLHITEWVEDER
jgi:ribonuclease Z